MVANPPCSKGHVDLISPPGAPMSGLMFSDGVMPQDVNEEGSPAVRFGNVASSSVQVMSIVEVNAVAMRPDRSAPSTSETETTGIVIAGDPAALAATCPETLL